MSTNKVTDKICLLGIVLAVLIMIAFCLGDKIGIKQADRVLGYEDKLFDTATVHTIDITMDDWDSFIQTAKDEEYTACQVAIDGETYANVALRAKGNTSLTQVESYGNDRYSFKIEFDHYDSSLTYHGLDKLCLNNIIQDNTYMKDYLVYRMMNENGVAAPLASYVYITVNGEDWGLYLAVEGVEESFLQRNFGKNYGELYKPDSTNMGGGRGKGKDFDAEQFDFANDNPENIKPENIKPEDISQENRRPDSDRRPPDMPEDMPNNMPDDIQGGEKTDDMPGDKGGMGGMMSSDDILLKYIDDNFDSYTNIFDNAKTKISESDQKRLIEALKTLNSNNAAEAVNIDSVISYFAVHNFVVNFDSYTGSMIHNYYLYEEDGKLAMLPWDYNLAFGGFQQMGGADSLINYPIDTPISGGSLEDRPMLAWIFANEEYTELYHQKLAALVSDYFDSGKFDRLMDDTIAMISPYVEIDPTKFCTYEEFTDGVETLREFCLLRAQSVTAQLDGTLGSTSDTQNPEDYITADDLVISTMGSMNHDNMGGGPGGEKPDDMPGEIPNGEKPDNMPGGNRPGGGRPGNQTDSNTPPNIPPNAPPDDSTNKS